MNIKVWNVEKWWNPMFAMQENLYLTGAHPPRLLEESWDWNDWWLTTRLLLKQSIAKPDNRGKVPSDDRTRTKYWKWRSTYHIWGQHFCTAVYERRHPTSVVLWSDEIIPWVRGVTGPPLSQSMGKKSRNQQDAVREAEDMKYSHY